MYRFALLEYFVQWSLALVPGSHEVHAGGDDDHECNEHIHLNLAKKGRLFLVQSSSKYCGGKQCEAEPGARFVKQLSQRCSAALCSAGKVLFITKCKEIADQLPFHDQPQSIFCYLCR